jgi:predicted dehydrogenase
MAEPVAVGLVGAGPWAALVHAPTIAAGPETRLAGVWARRPEAALALAAKHGAPPFSDLDALFDACEAVVFSVPPDVQPELAVRAARKGKALLLEKPIADSEANALRFVEAIRAAGVPTMLMLSYRFAPHVRDFVARAEAAELWGARGGFVSGGFLEDSPSAFGWRLERGALLDVGPHGIDLAWAALGPVRGVRASGDLGKLVALTLEHESGALSQLQFSARVPVEPPVVGLQVFGPGGAFAVDAMAANWGRVFANVRSEFAALARTREPHTLGIERGVELQRIIAEAERQLS